MSTMVSVFVSSSETHSERKFDLHLTVNQLKTKLETITGIPAASQKLVLCRSDDSQPIRDLNDGTRPLGYYNVGDWMTIKVSDLNPASGPSGQYSDVSQVEKFELTEEQYAERRDSLLRFKQQNKLGRFRTAPGASPPSEDPVASIPPAVVVGARCEVDPGEEASKKRGVIRFVGPTSFGKDNSVWVGVEYDEPVGRNDGSVQGQRYFQCAPKHGVFVHPERITVGDFPPLDLLEEDEEM